jgi:hypothetical protein
LTAVKFDGVYKIADGVVNILDKALIKREFLKLVENTTDSEL